MLTTFKMTRLDHHIGYLNYIEHWSCEALNSRANGLCLCYALIETLPDCCIEFETITEEIDTTSNSHVIYRQKELFCRTFKTLDHFLAIYDCDDFGFWHLTTKQLTISGSRNSLIVGLSWPIDAGEIYAQSILPCFKWTTDAERKN